MQPRNHAFDILCGLCILRMLALHVLSFTGHAQEPFWREVMAWTFFFMAFFFFKAGYFNKSTRGRTGPYLADRSRRLLLPYLSWTLIGDAVYFAFLPRMLALYHKPIEPLTLSMVWRRGQAFGNGPLWFLLSFFAVYVAAHFVDKALSLRRLRAVAFLLPLLPLASYLLYRLGNPLCLGLDNTFIGLYFFYLGRLWRKALSRLTRKRAILLSLALTLLFVLGNIFWHAEHTMSSNLFTGSPILATVNISAALLGLSGLLIALPAPRVPWLCFIGEHSMVFFVAHYPMLYAYKFTHLSFHRSIYGRWDDAIILLPLIVVVCAWLVPYVERVPLLSGRTKKPRS